MTGKMIGDEMISKYYRMRIDFKVLTEATYADARAFDTKVDSEAELLGESVEIFYGNPACGPYLYTESDDLDRLQKLEKKLKNIIYKQGWAVV